MQTLKKRRTKVAKINEQWRTERFGLTTALDAVVTLHPQARDDAGVGYVVLEFKEGVSIELRKKVVELLNGAELEARGTWRRYGKTP